MPRIDDLRELEADFGYYSDFARRRQLQIDALEVMRLESERLDAMAQDEYRREWSEGDEHHA